MTCSQWTTVGPHICRLGEDGTPHHVDAVELYASLNNVGATPSTPHGSKSSPRQLLPATQFQKLRTPLLIVIEKPVGPTQSPRLHLVVRHAGRDTQFTNLETDHVLIGDDWVALNQHAFEYYNGLKQSQSVSHDGQLTLRAYFTVLATQEDHAEFIRIIEQHKDSVPLTPDSQLADRRLRATLYPYQAHGVRWMLSVLQEGLGLILADEMGLGKTLQLIAVISELQAQGDPENHKFLIICPATLLENWRREIHRFAPYLPTTIHRGRERVATPSALQSYNVVVTSYETACRDFSMLDMIEWALLVADEAQAIKNPQASRTQTLKRFNAKAKIAVTGTPVENSLLDLWSLVDFAAPSLLGAESEFVEKFPDTPEAAKNLDAHVRPLMLRRLVAEVAADLPEKIEIPQPLVLTPYEESLYLEERNKAAAAAGGAIHLQVLTGLRRVCTHPCLVSGHPGDPPSASAKYQRLLELLEEVFSSKEKVLIFTSFHASSDLLLEDLSRRFRIPVRSIDGRTDVEDRQSIVDEFESCEGSAALVLNPRAAGTGLNLIGANHVIHYNPEWNPAIEAQATARAHRRGQKRPVTVHHLYYVGTIEEVMIQRMESKRNLASDAVVGVQGLEGDRADLIRALEILPHA